MPAAPHLVLVCGELLDSDRPAGVQATRGDSDLGPHPEFSAVSELSGSIVKNDGAVHLVQKACGHRFVLGQDGVGVAGPKGVDVLDGFLRAFDRLDRNDWGQILGAPIFRARRNHARVDTLADSVSPELAVRHLVEQPRQGRGGDAKIEQKRFRGSADSGATKLGVANHADRKLRVGVGVPIAVAIAIEMLESGDAALSHHPLDERLTSAWHDHIDQTMQTQHDAHRFSGLGWDQIDGLSGQTGGLQRILHHPGDAAGAGHAVAAAAEDHGVAGFQTEGSGVGGDIGAGLVDHPDHSQRNGDPADDQSVGSLPRRQLSPDRVGKLGHRKQALGYPLYALRIELEPVEKRSLHAGIASPAQILGVGLQKVALALFQEASRLTQGLVFALARGVSHDPAGFAGGLSELPHHLGQFLGLRRHEASPEVVFSRSTLFGRETPRPVAVPEVSVIIPNRNREASLRRAVGSVLAQRGVELELLVVDDASDVRPDGLYEELQEAGHRVLTLKSRSGPGAARNRGAGEARAPYLALLDSDDLWLPNKLARQLESLRGSGLRVGHVEEIWYRQGRQVQPLKAHRAEGGDLYSRSLRAICVSGSGVMVESSLFSEMGGFDEELFVCEDYDLWLRVAARERFDLVAEPLVIKHGGHPDQLSKALPAMDRFRIRALAKGLRSGAFGKRWQEARDELQRRVEILSKGSRKRGIEGTVELCTDLSAAAESGDWACLESASLRLLRLWPTRPAS